MEASRRAALVRSSSPRCRAGCRVAAWRRNARLTTSDRRNGNAALAGLSLVESILALALLATVLLAVAASFVASQRLVGSGRQSSVALTVARNIIEELQACGFHQVHGMLAAVACDPTVDPSCTAESPAHPVVARWQLQLDAAVAGARAEVSLEALDGAPLASTTAMRITARVRWVERGREREVRLVTVRL